MSVLEEGALDEEDDREENSPKPKSLTALSILESLAGPADADAADAAAVPATEDVPGEDAQSVESLGDSSGERLAIDDVFELEGLEVSCYSMWGIDFWPK